MPALMSVLMVVTLMSAPASAVVIGTARAAVGSIQLFEGAQAFTTNSILTEDSTGAKVWDAGRLLSTLLADMDLTGKRVLELGSGTGVGGLTAAASGASVTLTDGAEAMLPLLEENIKANGLRDRAHCVRLEWGSVHDAAELVAHGPWDMIIGSDLFYAPESHSDLLCTLEALCTPGHTEVLLAYPTRFTEGMFFDQAAELFDQPEWPEEVEPGLYAARMVMRDE